MPKKGGKQVFFGTDFTIIANIITNSGPDSRIDRLGGNLNRGFSMKNYPDAYFLNIIPALTWRNQSLLVRPAQQDLPGGTRSGVVRVASPHRIMLFTWRNPVRVASPHRIMSFLCLSVHEG